MNFTHIIDRMSFGIDYGGLKNPLDNSFELATDRKIFEVLKTLDIIFSCFVLKLEKVPTIFIDENKFFGRKVLLTNQYAVTDHARVIQAANGQAGVPGTISKICFRGCFKCQ
ncbi:hypothetical protein HK096_003627 [Nowakowskiella sp. JEL0078]|nr:hypothetical protein HK096_003627 [Nowakowskiella sp. JEL0078]